MAVHSYWTSQGNALYSAFCAEEIYCKTCSCRYGQPRDAVCESYYWCADISSVEASTVAKKEHVSELCLFMDVPVIYTMYTLRGTARMRDWKKL